MSAYVTKAIMILLADIALDAKSTEEIYEILAKIANVEEDILEPYHIAKEKKGKKIQATYKKPVEEDGKEAKWPDFSNEPFMYY